MNAKRTILEAMQQLPNSLQAQQSLFKARLAMIPDVPSKVASDLANYQAMLKAITEKSQKALDSLISKPSIRAFFASAGGPASEEQVKDLSTILQGMSALFSELQPSLDRILQREPETLQESATQTNPEHQPEAIVVDTKNESYIELCDA
jgi:hypothetical protein